MMNSLCIYDPDQPEPENRQQEGRREESPDTSPTVTLTVQDVVTAYVQEKTLQNKVGNLANSSLTNLKHYLSSFASSYGPLAVNQCRNKDLTEWLLAHDDRWGPYGKSDALKFVLACFRWAAGEGEMLAKCPFYRPKNMPRLEPRLPIKPEEYRAMMHLARACNGKGRRRRPSRRAFRLALFFLRETGARPCEMRHCLWTQFDWDLGLLIHSQHKTGAVTGQDRIIPLSRKLLRVLAWVYRRRPQGREHIFLNSRGRPWGKDFSKIFRKYADMAGVRKEISSYCLRHGFAVSAIESGIPDKAIADILGHSNTRLLSWYGRATRTNGEFLRSVLEKIHGK